MTKNYLLFLLGLCLTSFVMAQGVDLRNGLLAHYPFTGNTKDHSGNAQHGFVFGGVTLTEDRLGNQNAAYEFNGIDGYINTFSTFDIENLTLSVWINPYDIVGGTNPNNEFKRVAITMDDHLMQYGILRVDINNSILQPIQ